MNISCRLCFLKQLLHNSLPARVRNIVTSTAKLSGGVRLGTGNTFRLNVDLNEVAEQHLIDNQLKPKNHLGVFNLKRVELPQKFINSAVHILSHENVKSIAESAKELQNYLWSRHLPIEEQDYRKKTIDIENRITSKDEVLMPFLSAVQLNKLEASRDNKIRHRLKKAIYHWEQINYDRRKVLEYLIARSAGEYAALLRIFSEIQKKDPDFQPNTLCDFGSGLGTAIWASRSIWPNNIREVMCVDSSRDMNDLSELIFRGGNSNNDHNFSSLYFRQFLPQSSKIPYEIVVSAYSLLELPSLKARLEVLDILWKKTSNYLVIVEQGSTAGFKAIIEARDYILELDQKRKSKRVPAHVFSPCPNDMACPRFSLDDIPCNFSIKYQPLYPFHHDNTKLERFSYVVLKKGHRDLNDEQWPRLIENALIRKKHVICRVCTKEGNLSEILLTKNKHSQTLYRVGRKSKCGDLLPVKEIQDLTASQNFENVSHDEGSDDEVEEKR